MSDTSSRVIEIKTIDQFESNPTLMAALFSHAAAVPPFGPFSHLSAAEFCAKMRDASNNEIIETRPLSQEEMAQEDIHNNNKKVGNMKRNKTTTTRGEDDANNDENNEDDDEDEDEDDDDMMNGNSMILIDEATGAMVKQSRIFISYQINPSLMQSLFMKLWEIDQWRHLGQLYVPMDLRPIDVEKL